MNFCPITIQIPDVDPVTAELHDIEPIAAQIDAVFVHYGDYQEKTVTPTQERQIVVADAPHEALYKVTVEPIPSNYGLVTWDGSTLTVS